MDESKMILKAVSSKTPLKVSSPKKKKRLVDDSLCSGRLDVIMERAKELKKVKKRYINQWLGVDFVRHLNSNLSSHNLELETSSVRDQDWMNKLYDILVKELLGDMNNKVLREYLDWWVGSYAVSLNKAIYIKTLMNSEYIKEFIMQWKEKYNLNKPIIKRKKEEVDDYELYNIGGLSILLITRGIVIAWKILRLSKSTKECNEKISKVLNKFSKKKLIQVMDITLSGKYNKIDKVDFISIAKQSLQLKQITSYDDVSYLVYF